MLTKLYLFTKILIIFFFSIQFIDLRGAVPLVDLHDMAQDFVLETKQMHIPGYPDAFNPSIVSWNGSLLMTFRIRDPLTGSTNKIGFVWLDDHFDLNSDIQVLDIMINYPAFPNLLSFAQDPRLIQIDNDLFMVYSNLVGTIQGVLRRMFTSQLIVDDNGLIKMVRPKAVLNFEGEVSERQEKNWTPFEYNRTLLLAYSLTPHRILYPYLESNNATTIGETNGNINWPWGQLRGGTQALKIGNDYLSFFHSSKDMATLNSNGKKITHYFMGAYTFSGQAPFAITQISSQPIVGADFYAGPSYATWKPLRVVFPGGYVYDQNYLWIVYGKQDHEIWVVKLDKTGLFDSLVPVTELPN